MQVKDKEMFKFRLGFFLKDRRTGGYINGIRPFPEKGFRLKSIYIFCILPIVNGIKKLYTIYKNMYINERDHSLLLYNRLSPYKDRYIYNNIRGTSQITLNLSYIFFGILFNIFVWSSLFAYFFESFWFIYLYIIMGLFFCIYFVIFLKVIVYFLGLSFRNKLKVLKKFFSLFFLGCLFYILWRLCFAIDTFEYYTKVGCLSPQSFLTGIEFLSILESLIGMFTVLSACIASVFFYTDFFWTFLQNDFSSTGDFFDGMLVIKILVLLQIGVLGYDFTFRPHRLYTDVVHGLRDNHYKSISMHDKTGPELFGDLNGNIVSKLVFHGHGLYDTKKAGSKYGMAGYLHHRKVQKYIKHKRYPDAFLGYEDSVWPGTRDRGWIDRLKESYRTIYREKHTGPDRVGYHGRLAFTGSKGVRWPHYLLNTPPGLALRFLFSRYTFQKKDRWYRRRRRLALSTAEAAHFRILFRTFWHTSWLLIPGFGPKVFYVWDSRTSYNYRHVRTWRRLWRIRYRAIKRRVMQYKAIRRHRKKIFHHQTNYLYLYHKFRWYYFSIRKYFNLTILWRRGKKKDGNAQRYHHFKMSKRRFRKRMRTLYQGPTFQWPTLYRYQETRKEHKEFLRNYTFWFALKKVWLNKKVYTPADLNFKYIKKFASLRKEQEHFYIKRYMRNLSRRVKFYPGIMRGKYKKHPKKIEVSKDFFHAIWHTITIYEYKRSFLYKLFWKKNRKKISTLMEEEDEAEDLVYGFDFGTSVCNAGNDDDDDDDDEDEYAFTNFGEFADLSYHARTVIAFSTFLPLMTFQFIMSLIKMGCREAGLLLGHLLGLQDLYVMSEIEQREGIYSFYDMYLRSILDFTVKEAKEEEYLVRDSNSGFYLFDLVDYEDYDDEGEDDDDDGIDEDDDDLNEDDIDVVTNDFWQIYDAENRIGQDAKEDEDEDNSEEFDKDLDEDITYNYIMCIVGLGLLCMYYDELVRGWSEWSGLNLFDYFSINYYLRTEDLEVVRYLNGSQGFFLNTYMDSYQYLSFFYVLLSTIGTIAIWIILLIEIEYFEEEDEEELEEYELADELDDDEAEEVLLNKMSDAALYDYEVFNDDLPYYWYEEDGIRMWIELSDNKEDYMSINSLLYATRVSWFFEEYPYFLYAGFEEYFDSYRGVSYISKKRLENTSFIQETLWQSSEKLPLEALLSNIITNKGRNIYGPEQGELGEQRGFRWSRDRHWYVRMRKAIVQEGKIRKKALYTMELNSYLDWLTYLDLLWEHECRLSNDGFRENRFLYFCFMIRGVWEKFFGFFNDEMTWNEFVIGLIKDDEEILEHGSWWVDYL